MCKTAEPLVTDKQMSTDHDVHTLHQRIDNLTKKTEDFNKEVVKRLSELHTDVRVIRETCKYRGATCAVHVEELDQMMRGNGGPGVLTRLTTVEQKGHSKEKYAYLVIGALLSGLLSLTITLVSKLV